MWTSIYKILWSDLLLKAPLTKTENGQLCLPGMRKSREQMNQDNPFIGVSIQGTTTAAQVSYRHPYFSLALRSAIDCRDGPPGATGLTDSGSSKTSLLQTSVSSWGPRQTCSSRPHLATISFFPDRPRRWICPLVFSPIVEIVGFWTATAFKPFLKALWQGSIQVHGTVKEWGG